MTLSTFVTAAFAQDASMGEVEYRTWCATCHGTNGTGNGPFAEFLNNGAPSLTTLSKNSGGVFPSERVYRIIDGRAGVAGHGSAEMPVWGAAFSTEAVRRHGPFFGEFYAEEIVRARIHSLIEHLNSLQEE